MRLRLFFLTLTTFGVLQVASASSLCTTGTLASYEALGAGGCLLGGDTISSFTTISGITGATPIDPTLVEITPSGGTDDPVLEFDVNQTADANALLEAIFTYAISGPDIFTTDMTTLSNSSETVDGAVTDTQNYCVGGQFGPDGVDGCTGSTSGTLLTLDGIQNTDQGSFPGATTLSVTDDFVLDGGTAGSASGGTFVDQFTATSTVPEPSGIFLLPAITLAFAGFRKLRSLHRNS